MSESKVECPFCARAPGLVMPLLGVLLALFAPSAALAQCAEGESRLEVAFRPPATGGPVDRYELLAGPESGDYGEPIEIAGLTSLPNGRVSAVVGCFDERRPWFIAVRAVGPGGTSAASNELSLAIEPPGVPTDLELLERRVTALERRQAADDELVALLREALDLRRVAR